MVSSAHLYGQGGRRWEAVQKTSQNADSFLENVYAKSNKVSVLILSGSRTRNPRASIPEQIEFQVATIIDFSGSSSLGIHQQSRRCDE